MKKIKISISVILLLLQTMAIEAGVVQNEKGKCGYINESGALIIDYKYDFIGDFNQYGVAQVKNGNKYGMVNQNGELTVPIKYDEIGFFQDGVALLVSGKKYGLVSEQGKVLTKPQFVKIYSPNSQGVRIAVKKQKMASSKFADLGTYTLLNKDGQMIIPVSNGQMIGQFVESFGRKFYTRLSEIKVDTLNTECGYVYLQKGFQFIIYRLDGTIALDNSHRNLILKEVYGEKEKVAFRAGWVNYEITPYEDIVRFVYSHKKVKEGMEVVYGYYDLKESKLLRYYTSKWGPAAPMGPYLLWYVPSENIELFPFSDGFGVAWANQAGNERTELLNHNGDIVATFPAEGGYPYYNGYMVAKNNEGKYGLLDTQQNVVIPYSFQNAAACVLGDKDNPFLILQDTNQKYGAIDIHNQQIIPFEYQSMKSSPNISTVFVMKNNKWGAYDNSVQLLECKYDSLDNYHAGAFCCHINRGVSVYSVTGKKMSEQVNGCNGVFEADNELHNSTFFRCFNIENGTDTIYGYIDGYANEVLPFVFDTKKKSYNAYLIYRDLPTMTFDDLDKNRLILYSSRRERTYKLDTIVPENDWDY